MTHQWNNFDNGQSIGTSGSENGIITADISHIFGARITTEKNGNIAPYSLTIAFYGLMFHTEFCGNELESKEIMNSLKEKIEVVINHHGTLEESRDSEWNEKLHSLLIDITA